MYDITTIKEMEGGDHLQYQSPAPIREARGQRLRPGPARDRLFTPQLPRRDPPPALARHRYDSPVLGGAKRNISVRNSSHQLILEITKIKDKILILPF